MGEFIVQDEKCDLFIGSKWSVVYCIIFLTTLYGFFMCE